METLFQRAQGAATGGLALIFFRDLAEQGVVEDEAVAREAFAVGEDFEPRDCQRPGQKGSRRIVVGRFAPEHAVRLLQHVGGVGGAGQKRVDGPIECTLRRGEPLDELAHLVGGHVGHFMVSAESAEI